MRITDGLIFNQIGPMACMGAYADLSGSDRRYKRNIAPLRYGLNEILQLDPVSFIRTDGKGETEIGFIAQDVEPIIPEAVRPSPITLDDEDDSRLIMMPLSLLPALVNAIKELHAMIMEGRP